MREFASPTTRAAALSPPVKVLYTAFCGLTVAGLLSCVALYDGVVRFGARTTPAELYRHLKEEGRLFEAQGRWRRDVDLDEIAIPKSVRGVLERHVRPVRAVVVDRDVARDRQQPRTESRPVAPVPILMGIG